MLCSFFSNLHYWCILEAGHEVRYGLLSCETTAVEACTGATYTMRQEDE
jgi:hypothetical protein